MSAQGSPFLFIATQQAPLLDGHGRPSFPIVRQLHKVVAQVSLRVLFFPFMILLGAGHSSASDAKALSSLGHSEVVSKKWMPSKAVCFGEVVANECVSASKVFSMSHGLQMFGVAAESISAQVIDMPLRINNSVNHFIYHSMSGTNSSVMKHSAIARGIASAVPFPTASFGIDHAQRLNVFWGVVFRHGHKYMSNDAVTGSF
jgi:hypothetical protein